MYMEYCVVFGLLLALITAANVACMMVGAKLAARKPGRGCDDTQAAPATMEDTEEPEELFDPQAMEIMLLNIDNYDGTGAGQQDF